MGPILNFMFLGAGNRNRVSGSSIGAEQPDYMLILNSICLFRGVEKAFAANTSVPRYDLIRHIQWSYYGALLLISLDLRCGCGASR